MRHRLVTLPILIAVVAAALLAMPRGHALAADPPTITSFTPASVSMSGGTVVTIYGTGFQPGALVSIGGVLSPSATVVTTSTIAATVPAGNLGVVQVSVINPDGQTATASGFTYVLPSNGGGVTAAVTLLSPSSGPATGGQAVTIYGSGFDASASVTFGGVPATSVVWHNSGLLVAYSPPGAGAVSVVVTNPGGQAAASPIAYTYTGISGSSGALSVTSVTPSTMAAGSALTILGTGFVAGATVTVGGYPATNVIVVNSTQIAALAPAGPSDSVMLIVTNPDSTAAGIGGLAYGVPSTTTTTPSLVPAGQPSVTAVSPTTGSSAGGTTVSITGSGFVPGTTVTFGGVPATSVSVVSGTLITATAPPNPVGTVSVLVAGPSGSVGGVTAGFTYELAVPRVTAVSPSTGALAGGTTLTITGTGFAPGATVSVGGLPASTVSAVSPTQIVVSTPPGPPGAAVILVTNPGGAISGLASAFSYSANPQPAQPTGPTTTISGVSPSSGPATGGTTVTITGTGFQPGATVTIGGTVVPATVMSTTQIILTTPPVTGTGTVTVSVANPGAAASILPSAFTYTGTGQQAAPGGSSAPVPAGGGLFVFGGGSNAQLLTASGCNANTAVFWTTDSAGTWIGYIPSVPVAIVNAAWTALFPNGIPAGTPIFARC
ncbi:MAG: IPT/TIG domain-containing protein [Dehalococcoidia bacterium]